MNEQELDRAIREVIKRTLVDPEFRAKALSNGNGAVAEITRQPLPAGMSLTFVENYGKATKTIVLPDPIADSEQLLEEDLEQVAGGVAKEMCGSSCGSNSCLNT